MSRLDKFDNTLSELEEEIIRLKSTSKAFKKLEELSKTYDLILNKFKSNSAALEESAKKQQAKHEEVKTALANIRSENQNNLNELQQLNNSHSKTLNDSIEGLRRDNRQFYADFEQTVRIKLGEHKSEIKQLIENERLQIKDIIENNLEKQSDEIKQSHKTVKRLVWIFGIITMLLQIGILVKLFLPQ